MASRAIEPVTDRSGLSREEALGLGVAALAHVALFAWLAMAPPGKEALPPPDRMTVSLATEVSLKSTAPDPSLAPPASIAPVLGEAAAEPEPVTPQPITPPVPIATPVPAASPLPRAVPKAAAPAPRPVPKVVARPDPKPVAKPPSKPAAKAPSDTRDRRRPDTPTGGSRVGDDFLKGISGGNASSSASAAPAAAIGPQVTASLSQAIARQLKPNWTAPQGADADQLVTVLSWDLNEDGSLKGRPRVVSQSGVNASNSAQKDRHAEQAIRAVQLAAPFDLPGEYYSAWKRVASFRFDRKLSQ